MSKATVFVIDDDEACRDSVRELVGAAGLAVAVFSSAAEFLTAFDPAWHGCLVLWTPSTRDYVGTPPEGRAIGPS